MQHIGSDELRRDATDMAQVMTQSCVGLRVGRLNRLIGRCFESRLRPLDLTVAQMELLGALVMVGDPVRPADLSAWLASDRSTMSRNLAVLERRGLLVPTEVSPTGRTQRVTITDEGMALLVQARRAWTEAQQDAIDTIGADAIGVLDRWLEGFAADPVS